jgi:hypothetical protein
MNSEDRSSFSLTKTKKRESKDLKPIKYITINIVQYPRCQIRRFFTQNLTRTQRNGQNACFT